MIKFSIQRSVLSCHYVQSSLAVSLLPVMWYIMLQIVRMMNGSSPQYSAKSKADRTTNRMELRANFSAGVNMYNPKVTSYW